MASTLAGLVAAVVSATLLPAPVVPPALLESVVGRAVNREAETVAARRGIRLARLAPIPVRLVDHAHLLVAREAVAGPAGSPEEARDQAALYGALGLVDAGRATGARPGTASGPGAGPAVPAGPAWAVDIGGRYDPIAGRLLVGNWVALDAGRFARLHDVAEAVLDRRFRLSRFLTADVARLDRGARTDERLARQALVDGDATVQALEQLDPGGALPHPRALADLVEETRAALTGEGDAGAGLETARRLFVALDGMTFVAGVRARAPWTEVNAIWARPPRSSEQILHPEKYERRETPDDVGARLPEKLPGGWKTVYSDTLGELGARVFLTPAVGDYRAERAAAGWGGDRAVLYRGPIAGGAAPELVTWISTWDDPTDAEDFAAQAARSLGGLAGRALDEVTPMGAGGARGRGVGHDTATSRWRAVNARGAVFLLERRGFTVGMLLGAPADAAERILAPLMTAAARNRPPRGHALTSGRRVIGRLARYPR